METSAVEMKRLWDRIADLEMALWLVRCYGAHGETHDGYSVSAFVDKAITDDVARKAADRYAKWLADERQEFNDFLKATSEEVAKWPEWKRKAFGRMSNQGD